jgi:septum formation topological specificity factor MinE
VNQDSVVVRMDRGSTVSTLEIDVELPNSIDERIAVGF